MWTCPFCRIQISDATATGGDCPNCGTALKRAADDQGDALQPGTVPRAGAGTLDSDSGGSEVADEHLAETLESGPQGADPASEAMADADAASRPQAHASDALDETLDSASLEQRGRDVEEADADGIAATLQSDDFTGEPVDRGARTSPGRRQEETVDSGMDDAQVARELGAIWAAASVEEGRPEMTIKGRGDGTVVAKNLILQPRALRACTAGDAAMADYELMKRLGEGGMGVVYAARQASIDRTVALKMLKPDMAADKLQRGKFLSEAVVTGDLDHPNIVPIYDLGTNERGAVFYSMKCVQGRPWLDMLKEKSLQENLEILMRVADAVAFAHSRGVVHRDLKPENIMLGDFGEVLVMDWGLAMGTPEFSKSGSVTQSCTMGGTPAYMAPEMATGPFERIGAHSDIYLLGAILYEIVTGKPPHTGRTTIKCLFAASKNQIQPTDKTGELLGIALRAMATDPADRYGSVAEFQTAIRDYQSHSESIVLSSRAAEDLEGARESNDYQDYARAMFAFQEAAALWAGNATAQRGVSQAKLAYAGSALRKGDYDLGLSLLDDADPDHRETRDRLVSAQRERDARQHRLRTAKRLALGLAATVFIVVTGALFWVKAAEERARIDRDRALVAEGAAKIERDNALLAQAREREAKESALLAKQQEEKAKEEAIAAKDAAERARMEETKAKEAALLAQAAEREAKDEAIKLRDEAIKLRDAAVLAQKKETEAKEAALKAKAEEEKAKEEALVAKDAALLAQKKETEAKEAALKAKAEEEKAKEEAIKLRDEAVKARNAAVLAQKKESEAKEAALKAQAEEKKAKEEALAAKELEEKAKNEAIKAREQEEKAKLEAIKAKDAAVLAQKKETEAKEAALKAKALEEKARLEAVRAKDEAVLARKKETEAKVAALKAKELEEKAKLEAIKAKDEAVLARKKETEAKEAAVKAQAEEQKAKEEAIRLRDAAVLAQKKEAEAKEAALKAKELEEKAKLEAIAARNAAVLAQEKEKEAKEAAIRAKEAEEYEAYIARIGLAASKIEENDFDTALDLLTGCKLELRHWEWGRLMHLCLQSDETFALKAPADALDVSPEGDRFVTGGWDGLAQIRDAKTGKLLHELQHGGRFVYAVAFSPDGALVATGSDDPAGFLQLWDAETGERLRALPGGAGPRDFATEHTASVLSVDFSADGRRLLTSSFDKTARVWDVASGRQLQRLFGHNWWVWSAAFGPADEGRGETQIVTASQDGTAIVWTDPSGRWTDARQITQGPAFTGHRGPVYSAAIAPDGQRVVTGGFDKRVLIWRPDDVKEFNFDLLAAGRPNPPARFRALDGHLSAVRFVAFSRDGRLVLSGGHDNTVRVWNPETGSALKTFRGHATWVRSCAFGPDDRWILSASHDGTVKRWTIDGKREMHVLQGRVFRGHAEGVLSAQFSADGRQIVTASRDRSARTWAFDGRPEVTFQEGHSFLATSAAFFADGKRLVTGAIDNTARVWDVASGTQVMRLEQTGMKAAVAVSPDGKWIATGSDDHAVKLWTAEPGEDGSPRLVRTLEGHRDDVTVVGFSPDSRLLYSGDDVGRGKIWDVTTGQQVAALRGHTDAVTAVAFLPGGRRMLTASADKTVAHWDIATGDELKSRVLRHPGAVLALALSPGGDQALTSCVDEGVRLWDVASGRLVRTLESRSGLVSALAIAPDGRGLTANADDHTVRLWNLTSGKEIPFTSPDGGRGPFLDMQQAGGLLWTATFSPDGEHVLTVGGNDARMWDVSSGREQIAFSPHGAVASANFNGRGDRVVTGSWDNTAKVWNAATGKAMHRLVGHAGRINTAVYSPVEDYVVLTASDDGTAVLWNGETGKVLRTFSGHEGAVHAAVFSADGLRIVTASADRTARIWDARTGKVLHELRGHEWGVLCAAFSADGRFVITGSQDNARIWDAAAGRQLRSLQGHTAAITSVSFSPDGLRALTGSRDNTAKVWDPATGKEILTLSGHTEDVTSVAFSPVEGRHALTGSQDGTAIVWLARDWRVPDEVPRLTARGGGK